MWFFLTQPKCYTLINKMYDPIKDMRQTREKLNRLTEKEENEFSEQQMNEFIERVAKHIDSDDAPIPNTPFYENIIERLKLLRHLKNLHSDYPRHHRQLMREQSRESRESLKMMKEDDFAKI